MQIDLSVCVVWVHLYGIDLSQLCRQIYPYVWYGYTYIGQIYPYNADRSIRVFGMGTSIWDRSIPIMQIDLSVCVVWVHLYGIELSQKCRQIYLCVWYGTTYMGQIYPNYADRSIRMCGMGTPIWDRSIPIMQIDLSVCVVWVHLYGIDLFQLCRQIYPYVWYGYTYMGQIYPNYADRSIRVCGMGTTI